MIDINTYRSRIGQFSPKLRNNKFLTKSEYFSNLCENEDQSGKITLSILKCIFKIILIFSLLLPPTIDSAAHQIGGSPGSVLGIAMYCVPTIACSGSLWGHRQLWSAGWSVVGSGVRGGSSVGYDGIQEENYEIRRKIIDHNFLARYLYGNIIQKKKGILNMHLNIRSLRFKVHEVKHVIKQNSPNILGISEAELLKDKIDEKCLKIPGYDVLIPKSWICSCALCHDFIIGDILEPDLN